MASASIVVGVSTLFVGSIAAYDAVRIVEEGEVEALAVFGETKAVLHPGLNLVPPFVSETYPVDARTMTIDKGGVRVDVPAEFESAVREGASSAREATPNTGTDSVTASTRQRAATALGWTLFVLGAFGFAVPMFMLGHVLDYERWAVSGLFPDATAAQAVVATAVSLSTMVFGEQFRRRYET